MNKLILCLLCFSVFCHYTTWVQLCEVFSDLQRNTDYLERCMDVKNVYIHQKINELDRKLNILVPE